MMAGHDGPSAQDNTTDAVRAAAEPPPPLGVPAEDGEALPSDAFDAVDGLDVVYRLGNAVTRRGIAPAPERAAGDPIFRPLRIYTVDPGEPELEGGVDVISVPYERLDPGPVGRLLEVDPQSASGARYPRVDLEDPRLLMQQGLDPTPADPRFHQQMVYAVCSQTYAVFQRALGREPEWGFDPQPAPKSSSPLDGERLRVRPFALRDRNASYSKEEGALDFGFFTADEVVTGVNLPGGFVFTALAHDVIAHEMTHALLDGLRAHFAIMSGPDVAGFHEGFADLIALLQHFSYKGVVREALRRARGRLAEATILTEVARQFGHTTSNSGNASALRTVLRTPNEQRVTYKADAEAHALGSVLANAVFEAFTEIFRRRTEQYFLLATNGTGTLPAGEIPAYLLDVLAREASKLAEQFLSILIRAIDYCPPVDLQLGEYLRAIVTADRELLPSDPLRYRATLTRVLGSYGIYPPDVSYLSEDELQWDPPEMAIPPVEGLTFARLRFRGDPAHPASRDERRRQACALGQLVTKPQYLRTFGLAAPGDPALKGDAVDLPCVESVRTARRIGPDGQILFDLVAEVTQRRLVGKGAPGAFDFFGGSTVIIDPNGRIRYVIRKGVVNAERLERQRSYMADAGRALWVTAKHRLRPRPSPFALLHRRRTTPA